MARFRRGEQTLGAGESHGRLEDRVLRVSPRFHRLHHSKVMEDRDVNYGNIFAFWDHLFGTIAPRYSADPANADDCPLGLDEPESEARYNQPFAILFGTLQWSAVDRLRAWRAARIERASARPG